MTKLRRIPGFPKSPHSFTTAHFHFNLLMGPISGKVGAAAPEQQLGKVEAAIGGEARGQSNFFGRSCEKESNHVTETCQGKNSWVSADDGNRWNFLKAKLPSPQFRESSAHGYCILFHFRTRREHLNSRWLPCLRLLPVRSSHADFYTTLCVFLGELRESAAASKCTSFVLFITRRFHFPVHRPGDGGRDGWRGADTKRLRDT